MLDSQVTDGHDVLRDKALHRTRAILNGELGAICLMGRRCLRVVLCVQEARNGRAFDTRNPQIARAGATVSKGQNIVLARAYPVSRTTLNYGK